MNSDLARWLRGDPRDRVTVYLVTMLLMSCYLYGWGDPHRRLTSLPFVIHLLALTGFLLVAVESRLRKAQRTDAAIKVLLENADFHGLAPRTLADSGSGTH